MRLNCVNSAGNHYGLVSSEAHVFSVFLVSEKLSPVSLSNVKKDDEAA